MATAMTQPTMPVSRNSSTAEIVWQLIAVQHRALGEHLQKLDVFFHQMEAMFGQDHTCQHTAQLFARFKKELRHCMIDEECDVLPEIERWANRSAYRNLPPPAQLLSIADDLAKRHAKLFAQSLTLIRRVRDLEDGNARGALLNELQSALSSFCDDFYRQLYEKDCLLLPRVLQWCPRSSEPAGEACPR